MPAAPSGNREWRTGTGGPLPGLGGLDAGSVRVPCSCWIRDPVTAHDASTDSWRTCPAHNGGSEVVVDEPNAAYIRQLEDAVNLLWGWMPAEQVREIRTDLPVLADFCRHNHQKVSHEEAMVRRTDWSDERIARWNNAVPNDGSETADA